MLFAAVGKGGAMWAGLLAIIGNVVPPFPSSRVDGRWLLEQVLYV